MRKTIALILAGVFVVSSATAFPRVIRFGGDRARAVMAENNNSVMVVPNLMPYSEDFETTALWASQGTHISYTAGQADPFGGYNATFIYNSTTPWTVSPQIRTQNGYLDAILVGNGQFCFSIYVQEVNVNPGENFQLRIWNSTKSQYSYVQVSFDTNKIGAIAYTGNVDAYGLDDVGGGFYRVWLGIDWGARGYDGDAITFRFWPFSADLTTYHGRTVFGAQINEGLTPSPYMKTP